MTTAGRWPWKPASAKECVTAHQPNEVVLKMNEALLAKLYRAEAPLFRRVGVSNVLIMGGRVGRIPQVGLKRAVASTWTGRGSRSW